LAVVTGLRRSYRETRIMLSRSMPTAAGAASEPALVPNFSCVVWIRSFG
jgi:hypothetical protein